MHFINEYFSVEDDVAVTVRVTEVTIKDGSTHLVPVVNTAALRLLSKRRLEKDEDYEAVEETGYHQEGNSLRNKQCLLSLQRTGRLKINVQIEMKKM